jgi:hypothetical protein
MFHSNENKELTRLRLNSPRVSSCLDSYHKPVKTDRRKLTIPPLQLILRLSQLLLVSSRLKICAGRFRSLNDFFSADLSVRSVTGASLPHPSVTHVKIAAKSGNVTETFFDPGSIG